MHFAPPKKTRVFDSIPLQLPMRNRFHHGFKEVRSASTLFPWEEFQSPNKIPNPHPQHACAKFLGSYGAAGEAPPLALRGELLWAAACAKSSAAACDGTVHTSQGHRISPRQAVGQRC